MTALIDGTTIKTREELHDALAEQLALPKYYGRTLDALYDCLTDIFEDTELRIVRFDALNEHLGLYAEVLRDMLRNACAENPRLHTVWED